MIDSNERFSTLVTTSLLLPTRVAIGIVVLSLPLLAGCGAFSSFANFSGSEKVDEPGSAKELNSSKTDDDKDSGLEVEDTSAERPSMVAGAFLTCVDVSVLRSVGGSDSRATYGCSVRDQMGKVALHENVDWQVEDTRDGGAQASTPIGAVFTDALAEDPHHIYVHLERSRVIFTSVVANISGGLSGDETDLRLTRNLREDTLDYSLAYGHNLQLVLGNNTAKDSSCKEKIDAERFGGERLAVQFEVLEETRVALGLRGLCGVDYSNTSRVTIRYQGGLQTSSGSIDTDIGYLQKSATDFDSSMVKLAPGRYEINIQSLTHNLEASAEKDDYIIGNVYIFADREVSKGNLLIYKGQTTIHSTAN